MTDEASREALLRQVESGKMKVDAAKMLQYYVSIYPGGAVSPFAEQRCGLDKKSTGKARLTQLLDLGLLKGLGHLQYDGYKHTVFQYVPDPEEQKRLSKERHEAKLGLWLARGEREFNVDIDSIRYKQ